MPDGASPKAPGEARPPLRYAFPVPDGPTLFWIAAAVGLRLAWGAARNSLAERLATALQVFLFGGCR